MFSFGKKKIGQILATQSGKAVPLTEVPDAAFSEKMLGDGVAIIPEENRIFSPVSGTVIDVTETLHAYCIEADDGLEVLVHIGINTVELKGEGFKSFVKNGDRVKAGDMLAEADIGLLKEKGYPIYTPIIITNLEAIKELTMTTGEVQAAKSGVLNYTLK